jgi:hypothetical protein
MKRWYKEREQLFLFRKLTDISKQNTIFVKDVDAPTDCFGIIIMAAALHSNETFQHLKQSCWAPTASNFKMKRAYPLKWLYTQQLVLWRNVWIWAAAFSFF